MYTSKIKKKQTAHNVYNDLRQFCYLKDLNIHLFVSSKIHVQTTRYKNYQHRKLKFHHLSTHSS